MVDATCLFCKIIAGQIPAFKVYEDEHTFAFLDIAPFEKGHVLVVPKHHAAFLTDLRAEVLVPFITAVQNVAALLLKKMPCDGFNLVQNNGACATQVVPHVHFHIIPRDANAGLGIEWPAGELDPDAGAALARKIAAEIR